jgi:hypothetical protein
MRHILLGLTALAASCVFGGGVQAQTAPDSIEVVYHPGRMFFSIPDGGEGRFRLDDDEDYSFPVTHDDYVRIRDLLEPYRAGGLVCDKEVAWEHNGYLVWNESGVETRRPHESICFTEAATAAKRSIDQAYYAMEEMADERWVPPAGLSDPDRLTLTWLYWGKVTENWSIPRGGEASSSQAEEPAKTFLVSATDFDRLRDLFRPYEGGRFECERVIADGPYGRLVWSQAGHEDQQLNWDAGCITGDAADVFERVDQAETLLERLRDGG